MSTEERKQEMLRRLQVTDRLTAADAVTYRTVYLNQTDAGTVPHPMVKELAVEGMGITMMVFGGEGGRTLTMLLGTS